jgi:hypothetical protein
VGCSLKAELTSRKFEKTALAEFLEVTRICSVAFAHHFVKLSLCTSRRAVIVYGKVERDKSSISVKAIDELCYSQAVSGAYMVDRAPRHWMPLAAGAIKVRQELSRNYVVCFVVPHRAKYQY